MERLHLTLRDTFVVLLTLTTGAVDAGSFLGLGKVFSSVITGNLVLLGIAAGTDGSALAVRAGVALAGYSAGVVLGAPIAARRDDNEHTWPRRVTITLAVELAILVAFSIGWELAGGHPEGNTQLPLVALLAAAMGMQGAAVRQLGQMSSTYMTSTLTAALAALTTRSKVEGLPRSFGVLTAIVIGAVAGGAVVKLAPVWLPALVLVPLGLVVALSRDEVASFLHGQLTGRAR